MAAIVATDGLLTGEAAEAYRVGGVAPEVVAMPSTSQEAAALIRLAGDSGSALTPWGGGTQMGLGHPPRRLDLVLSTQRMNQVVDYQPDDMTVTVQPGVTMTALQRLLAGRGQFLPLNPPGSDHATAGGTVAAAASGPWRAQYGTPRDWVIGCRVLDGAGEEIRGGGQVVKNVAGYDLPKLYTGSFGTLGLLSEITFKVLPAPPVLGGARVNAADAPRLESLIAAVMASDLQPASLEASFVPESGAWEVVLEFRHVAEAVEWQLSHLEELAAGLGLKSERMPDPQEALRRHADRPLEHPFLARMSTVSSAAASLGQRVVEVARRHDRAPLAWISAATGQVWFQAADASTDLARDLRSAAAEGGATCLFPRLPDNLLGEVDPWGEVGPELKLMQGLKAALDPAGTFSPGRFVGRL